MRGRGRGNRGRWGVAALAAAAMAMGAAATGAAAADGLLMAKLGDTTTDADAREVAGRTGLTHVETIPELGWAAFGYTGDRLTAHDALRADPAVFRIDFTRVGEELETQAFGDPWTGATPTLWTGRTPDDDIWTRSWVESFDGQPVLTSRFTVEVTPGTDVWAFWHWARANFPAAWEITTSSPSTAIAVIDGEFQTDHPELTDKTRGGFNFAGNNADVRFAPGDDPDGFHGSHVLGLIAARTNNGQGVSGACWDCVAIPYKIGFGGGTEADPDQRFIFDLTRALMAAADTDAVAVSMSVGTKRDHAALRDAIAHVRSKGKVMVASAGNSQQTEPGIPNYPSHYPGVIAVAATTPDHLIADFSLHNPNVDIAAPGHPIVSTTGFADPKADFGQGYRSMSGTSMATPIVAGLVGLMKSVRPDLTPDEVESILKSTATDRGAAGHDPVYGAGIIDAGRAVAAARDYQRPAPPPAPAAPAASSPGARPAVLAGRLTVDRSGRYQVRVRCTGTAACAGTVQVRTTAKVRLGRARPKVVSLGTAKYSVAPGKTRTVRVTLPRASRATFTRARRQVGVTVVLRPRGAKAVTAKRVLVGSALLPRRSAR